MRKLAAVLILLGPILFPQEGFSEQVARIVCPREAKAKIAWIDKIGEDPTLSRQSPPDELITFGFKDMQQIEQTISCVYVYTNGTASLGKHYEYTAKRKIRSCTKVSARVLDCTLE